jgi:hypothetical protein
MAPKEKPQISFDDNIIEDADLEKMLDDRQDLREAHLAYQKKDKEVKSYLKGVEYTTPYRVGRYIIDRNIVEPREIEFETSGGVRFNIKKIGE